MKLQMRLMIFILVLCLTMGVLFGHSGGLSVQARSDADAEVGQEQLTPTPSASQEDAVESLTIPVEPDETLVPEITTPMALSTEFRKFSTLGGVVVVIQNGKITFTYCYGNRDGNGSRVTLDTGFQVASIGKMIANIGLMQLVEQGKASLDDDLSDLFGFTVRNPQYPNAPITLRQLMTHTAGLEENGFYETALVGNVRELNALFTGSRKDALYSEHSLPGKFRRYCNFGGGLIGSLIEKLSGQQVDDYMTEHVFEPLGIVAAYQPNLLPEAMPLADMHRMPSGRLVKTLRDDEPVVTEANWEKAYVYTAGKLVISAPDLAKLLIVLCDGGVYGDVRILKESTVFEMTQMQTGRGSVSANNAQGLFMNIITNYQVKGRTLYGHGGKANGMLCAAYFDPTDRTGVVMLTNGCDNQKSYYGCGLLGRRILTICYDEVIGDDHVAADPFLIE